MKRKLVFKLLTILAVVLIALFAEQYMFGNEIVINRYSSTDVLEYNGELLVELNNNIPEISVEDAYKDGVITPFQKYADLDIFGRSGEAYVCISAADMPDYERGSIQRVHPSGWHLYNTKELWDVIFEDDSFYLYNRCHIIGFQLTGIDEEHGSSYLPNNLFTGTRQLNVEGMLPIENEIATYLRFNKDGYVLYKATPVYKGNNLLASGIHLQALSLDGEVKLNVYVHNVQEGFEINYQTGEANYENTY